MAVNRRDFVTNSEQSVGSSNERSVVTDGHLLHLPPDPFRINAKQFRFLRWELNNKQLIFFYLKKIELNEEMEVIEKREPCGGDRGWRREVQRHSVAVSRKPKEGGLPRGISPLLLLLTPFSSQIRTESSGSARPGKEAIREGEGTLFVGVYHSHKNRFLCSS